MKKTKDEEQLQAFKRAAKEIGADDSEEEFERKLGQIAKAKLEKEKPAK